MNYKIIDRLQIYSLSNYRYFNYTYLNYIIQYALYPMNHNNVIYCQCIKCEICNDVNYNDIDYDNTYYQTYEDNIRKSFKNHVFIESYNYGKCDMSTYCRRCKRHKSPEYNREYSWQNKNNIIHRDNIKSYASDRISRNELMRKHRLISIIPCILSIMLFPFTMLMLVFGMMSDWIRAIIEFVIYRNENSLYYFANIDNIMKFNIFDRIKYLVQYTMHIMYRPTINKIKDDEIQFSKLFYYFMVLGYVISQFSILGYVLFLFISLFFCPVYLNYAVMLIIATVSHIPFICLNYLYIFSTYMFYMIRIAILDYVINKTSYPLLLCYERYHDFENPNNEDKFINVDYLIDFQCKVGTNICKIDYSVIIYHIITLIPKTLIFTVVSFLYFIFRIISGKIPTAYNGM